MPKVETPHFAFPFSLAVDNVRVLVWEQDSDEEIVDCVEVLLSTSTGERIEAPDYGIDDQVFRENGADMGHLSSRLNLWEPRAVTDLEPEQVIDAAQRVRVRYRRRDLG